jgi:hypothetical protein
MIFLLYGAEIPHPLATSTAGSICRRTNDSIMCIQMWKGGVPPSPPPLCSSSRAKNSSCKAQARCKNPRKGSDADERLGVNQREVRNTRLLARIEFSDCYPDSISSVELRGFFTFHVEEDFCFLCGVQFHCFVLPPGHIQYTEQSKSGSCLYLFIWCTI